jgi:uncharacterized protein (TIGR03790 family)
LKRYVFPLQQDSIMPLSKQLKYALRQSVWFVLTGLLFLNSDLGLYRRPMLSEAMPAGGIDAKNLAVVVNDNDPYSLEIGALYVKKRLIPAGQVIHLSLPTGVSELPVSKFRWILRDVNKRTPQHIQAYALAWTTPYRVGCQSITSAFAYGIEPGLCQRSCKTTRLNPYYARGDIYRPWDQLKLRPTMLLASSNIDQGKALIRRGLSSDGSAPKGTGYLMSTSDPFRNSRASLFEESIRSVGEKFKLKIIRSDSLANAQDVMAYFTGLTWVKNINTNHFLPGAVADHLTSFGGKLTDSGQMSSLRWLDAGATGSYGTVVEPCNYAAKFPHPGLLLTYYLRGDTLIESYWRSVAMPGQGLFIGEPLARPWAPQTSKKSPLKGGASDAKPMRGKESSQDPDSGDATQAPDGP